MSNGVNSVVDGGERRHALVSYDLYQQVVEENKELKARIREIAEAEYQDGRHGYKKVMKGEWSQIDRQNACRVSLYCRDEIYRYYKFLPYRWWIFSQEVTTVCGRMRRKMVVPRGLTWEYYWNKKGRGIVNKKFIDFRNNDRTALRRQFISEYNFFGGELACEN